MRKMKKLITGFLILISICLMYGNYLLVTGYYDSNYYDVDITSDVDEIVFDAESLSETATIHIKNSTRKILSSQNNIFLSYHLLDKDGGMVQWDMQRFNLSTINPYNSGSLTIDIAKPEQAGEYKVEVDLVEEGVCWFGAKGNETLILKLCILPMSS